MKPQVSVVITTHNRPHLLPRAVASAWAAGSAVEVVVVDDASSDETAVVCRTLPRIKYMRIERNQRVAGARNVGILACEAPYISFLDDDDRRLPGTLDLQTNVLDREPAVGMVYCPMIVGDAEGEPTLKRLPKSCPQGDIFWELLQGNFIPCLSAVFRKDCLLQIGLLNSRIPGIDDWDLWVRIAELCPVAAIDEPCGIWRSPTPESNQGSARADLIYAMMARHQLRLLQLPRARQAPWHQRRLLRRALLNMIFNALVSRSGAALSYGSPRHFLLNAGTACRVHPLRVMHPITLPRFMYALYKAKYQKGPNSEA